MVPFKEVFTNVPSGDKSTEIEFEAMMVNVPIISGSETRYITAGLEYGNSEYIWVAHAATTNKATLKTMSVSKRFYAI